MAFTCLSNLHCSGAVLEAGGSSLAKAVKVNVFLANMDDFAAVNEVYGKFFPDPKPVCTLLPLMPEIRADRLLGTHLRCSQDASTWHRC